TYNYIDDISQQAQENIISGPYVHVPISSYMSQNTDHHIHDIHEQNSNQNQPQHIFSSFFPQTNDHNNYRFEIPGFEIIIRPTFSLDVNLDNFDIQNLNPI